MRRSVRVRSIRVQGPAMMAGVRCRGMALQQLIETTEAHAWNTAPSIHLTKALAQGRSRRSLLKGFLGLGGAATVGALLASDTDAARRGYSGPKPQPTVVPGPPTCNSQNCYGCRECVNGVCTANPQQLCYDHTNECLTSVCNPDGGCSYPFDCRVKEGCCGFDQYCDLSTGACMNCPGNLCQSSAAGPVCCSGATPNCCDQNGTLTCVAADSLLLRR